MITFTITPEQFDKVNRNLSEVFDIEYSYIEYSTTTFESSKSNFGRLGTLGYKYTEEQRKNISNSKKGKPSPMKGLKLKPNGPHSEESKKKMSISCKNRPKTSCILCKKVINGQSNFLQHYKFNH